jgi:hypothetical protein
MCGVTHIVVALSKTHFANEQLIGPFLVSSDSRLAIIFLNSVTANTLGGSYLLFWPSH